MTFEDWIRFAFLLFGICVSGGLGFLLMIRVKAWIERDDLKPIHTVLTIGFAASLVIILWLMYVPDTDAAERRIPIKNERLLERQIERDKQRLQRQPKQAHVTYYMRVDELKAGRPQLERQRKRAARQRLLKKLQNPRFRARIKANPELKQALRERVARQRGRNR